MNFSWTLVCVQTGIAREQTFFQALLGSDTWPNRYVMLFYVSYVFRPRNTRMFVLVFLNYRENQIERK